MYNFLSEMKYERNIFMLDHYNYILFLNKASNYEKAIV
jgi:hypothetical protein